MHLEQEEPARGRREQGVGYHDYEDWRSRQTVFNDLAAFFRGTVNLSDDVARPQRYFGGFMTANAFDVLGVQPLMGRGFAEGEDRPGAPPVAVIAHSVWDVRFDRDPDIVGRTVRVNGTPTPIVGVMPEGFAFPYWEDIWLPMQVDPLTTPRGRGPTLEVYGRLLEGVSLEEARVEFDWISARLAAEYPETNDGIVAFVEPYIDSYHGDDGALAATFLLGFGISVLLIACFNVANLLLAQAMTQVRELAVRVAMGASRGRVVARILQQAFLLASSGAVLGAALAALGMMAMNRWITSVATFPLPFWMEMKVDGPVLLFVLGAVGISVLASGILPGIRASRTDVHGTLTDASRGNSSLRIGRVSRLMVLAQITITAVLLILAGQMALQVSEIRRADHGYPTTEVFTARVGLFEGVFPERDDRLDFFRELVRRLEEMPGVEAASLATALPGTESGITRAELRGEVYGESEEMPTPRLAQVSPGFFEALETPVLEGRGFQAFDDDDGPPVALVNRPFAQRFFSGEDPVGRQIRVGWPEPLGEWRTIVGVVPDMDLDGAMDPAGDPEAVYLPLYQADARFVSIVARVRGDPMAFTPAVRDEVMALQGDTPIYFVRTLHDAINTNLLDIVLVGSLIWALALAAFLLASVGLFGVTSFLASQRTRELGVRIALGARGGDVLRLVIRRGATQVLLGLALGLAIARGLHILFALSGLDTTPSSLPVTLAACLVLGFTGLAAVYLPARRATKVDPVEALRAE
jgi:predicted permease